MNNPIGNGARSNLRPCFACTSPEALAAPPRRLASIVMCLFAMVVATGCASTTITDREQVATGQLPRPANIWVYAFAATSPDVPADSALAGQFSDHDSQTAEHIATGRKLGEEIASELVEQILLMGMSARYATMMTATPQVNDIVIRGYLISFSEGSEAKRIAIGLGSGSSELKVAVEGLQITEKGLRELGSGATDATGSKGPGSAVGAATFLATANPAGLIVSTGMKVYGEASGRSTVEGRAKQTAKEIADVLKKRFKEQGWI
jgi:hypothetical protein